MSRLRASCRLFALFALVSGCADDGPGSVTPAPTPDGGPVDAASDGHHDAPLGDADGAADAPPFDGSTKLSETGLYADITTGALAPGVAEFTVRFPLWSDGAEKQRYLALPAGSTIDTTVIDVWTFPVGTKAWKSFTRDGKRLETRLLWKRPEGWLMVAYAWNEAGTEAIATPEGTQNALGTNHDVPSAAQCRQCHDNVGDVLIGVGAIQLSQENGGGFLSTLIKQGSLSPPLTAELPVPGDGEVEAAIGYLHGNCGHCHNDESFVGKLRPLRLKLRTDAKTPEETPVYKTALYAPTLHPTLNTTQVIVPGSPGKSQLYQRMNVRGLEGMPPLATEEVDSTAMTTIWKWISGLPP